MNSNSLRLPIFDTFKTKSHELTGEAKRQRSIIAGMSQQSNPSERTRTSISQRIAEENGIIWKNIYSGIFRDFDEFLIPLGIVEEEGRLPLKRGPKALQEKGIPYYRLTHEGLLVSLSLNENVERDRILNEFFVNASIEEKEFQDIIQRLSKIAPKFTYSLFEKYVKAYCNGTVKNLLPFTPANLKRISDESLINYKEFLEGFSMLSKPDKEDTMKFFMSIS